MKPTPSSPPETVDVLAFGAHPDDIEFGCGAVIALETQAGRSAHCVVCSRGESGTNGTPDERVDEATQGAALLGASVEFVELGGDAHMEYRFAHVLTFAAMIRKFRPSVILAPTVVEHQHPDHAVVGRLVRDATRLARYGGVEELKGIAPHAITALFHYAVTPDGEPKTEPAMFVDTSATAVTDAWKAAMEAHATQLRTRRYVELQLARAQVLGLRSGGSSATALWSSEPLVVSAIGGLRTARGF